MGLAPFMPQSHAKLPHPILVYPKLRCPSDIQALRAETSSSSPDLDILVVVVCLVCLPLYLPFAVITISFVTIREFPNST